MAIPCLWCGQPGHIDSRGVERAVCGTCWRQPGGWFSTSTDLCDFCMSNNGGVPRTLLVTPTKKGCSACFSGDTYRARQTQQQAQAPTVQFWPPGAATPMPVPRVLTAQKIRETAAQIAKECIVDGHELRAARKRDGLCVECGDRGEFRGMACFCTKGHGKIFG